MRREWRAFVTVSAVSIATDEQLKELHRNFADTVRRENGTKLLRLTWRLAAPGLPEAAQRAFRAAAENLDAVLGGKYRLVDFRVVTMEQADMERDHPEEQELMSYGEAAAELGVTRQRVAQLDGNHPDLPRPLDRTGAGPAFTADSIRSFAARWNRNPGRRRKS